MTTGGAGSVPEVVAAGRRGEARAVGRLLTAVENRSAALPAIWAALPHGTGALTIGLTGPPGVGKSTLTSALVVAYRRQDLRVAVLAVDPSSPFTGGAVLGDRIRMQQHALDDDVFIRSMASRGQLGGLSVAAPQAVRLLTGLGFDIVLVESVGVGQSEVDIAGLTDVTAVVLAPGMGDDVQAAKAGILEIGDLFVVNKSDRDGAQALVRALRTMLALGAAPTDSGRVPIVTTVAHRDEGVVELQAAIAAVVTELAASGESERRAQLRARHEIEGLVLDALRARLDEPGGPDLDALAAAVGRGELDAYQAAAAFLGG